MFKYIPFLFICSLVLSMTSHAAMVDEIKEGRGDYVSDTPVRNSVELNAVQQAWNESEPSDSVKFYSYDPSMTIKVVIREYMESTIVLPTSENISTFTWGDKINFHVMRLANGDNSHILKIAAKYPDADTNLTVFGDSGNIYSFYVRVHSVNSKYIPHLILYVDDHDIEQKMSVRKLDKDNSKSMIAVVTDKGQEDIEGEYLRKLQISDPAKLNFKYKW